MATDEVVVKTVSRETVEYQVSIVRRVLAKKQVQGSYAPVEQKFFNEEELQAAAERIRSRFGEPEQTVQMVKTVYAYPPTRETEVIEDEVIFSQKFETIDLSTVVLAINKPAA